MGASMADASNQSGFWYGAYRWFVGAFLLVLMVLALVLNALVFSARSFQQNFASVTGQTVFSLSDVNDISRGLASIDFQLEPLSRQLAAAESQLDAAKRKVDALNTEIDSRAQALAAALAPVETGLQLNASDETSTAALQARVDRLAGDKRVDKNALAGLTAQIDQINALAAQEPQANSDLQVAQNQASGLTAQMQGERQSLLSADPLLSQRLQNNFGEIKAEVDSLRSSSPFGLGLTLAQVHPSSLSSLLVCTMGALGAMLFLFPAYVANKPEWQVTFGATIVRMVFGMVTAFAFYILANSAIAAFAVGGGEVKAANAESLNPFTVAGLGVIAGLMADDIARWIHKRGKDMFADNAQGVRDTVSELATGEPGAGLAGVNVQGGPNDPA
jgi:hypothetical protein